MFNSIAFSSSFKLGKPAFSSSTTRAQYDSKNSLFYHTNNFGKFRFNTPAFPMINTAKFESQIPVGVKFENENTEVLHKLRIQSSFFTNETEETSKTEELQYATKSLNPEMPFKYSTFAPIEIDESLYRDESMPIKDQIGDEKVEEEEYQAIKRPFQPHNKKQKRKHGFLHRLSTRSGRKILENRKRKGRINMAV